MAKKSDPLTVTKLDAARRQIETAISLWFEDGDTVAIHTLTAAGHQVCHAITKSKGETVSFLFQMDWLPEEHRSHYKKFLLRPENFFKHATSDPDPLAGIDFDPSLTDAYLFDACNLFHRVNGGKRTPLMMAFQFRFQLSHPELVTDEFLPVIKEPLAIEMAALSRRKFLKQYLELLALLQEV